MEKFALTIPGFDEVETPPNIPSGVDSSTNVIQASLNLLVIVGIVAALIFTLYGGVLWITSSGDKAKIDKARRTIIFSIIGIIVMVLAWSIVGFIGYILGSPPAFDAFTP